ncbi:hypothetical protein QAD02_000206 [Eretmocerus hayati]|uniref:Uncharacterized protein n=1 Tax=Eretmocerus hayati TaxID=131215 RepID=A0ACC2ND06_9HYME|nr:hypothetical protein QAD02_000206 [Eretmocerus hayati]
MGKVDINNEIILLRKNVEQARVHVVKKLTRDAHKLRTKKGTDAQKAKNLRKADRIAAEILSIKKVKRDEITKYALTSEVDLKTILQDQKSKPLVRIMARIASHKKFSDRLAQFKVKFPDYMEFLGPGRKKRAKLERSERKKGKANQPNTLKASKDKRSDESACGDCEESSNESDPNAPAVMETDEEKETKPGGSKKQSESDNGDDENESTNESDEKRSKTKKSKKLMAMKDDKSQDVTGKSEDESDRASRKPKEKKTKEKKSKSIVSEMPKKRTFNSHIDSSRIVSKQAIVKKFTDVLKEEECKNNLDGEASTENKSDVQLEKEVDPFFVTGDGETSYLSVALPKSKVEEDSDDNSFQSNKRKFSRHQNDKFFSKVPKFKDKHPKFHSTKADSKWSDQRHSGSLHKGNMKDLKGGMKSFSRDPSSKSKFNQKPSKSGPSTESESLHPSWQAKKKQQDILKQGFQGKKIVFDDDV